MYLPSRKVYIDSIIRPLFCILGLVWPGLDSESSPVRFFPAEAERNGISGSSQWLVESWFDSFCVLCGRKRRLESLTRTREQKFGASLSDKIKICAGFSGKIDQMMLEKPKKNCLSVRFVTPMLKFAGLFRNESFCPKLGSRSSLTRTSHWLRRQKTRACPNTIFPRSTQH
jgi:hypothetical protein